MRKNKILLVNPPYDIFKKNSEFYMPLGLGYISSFLKASGFDVSIFDANWRGRNIFKSPVMYDLHPNMSYENIKLEKIYWSRARDIIKALSPDILGIHMLTPTYDSALKIAKIAKQLNPDITVIAGAIHATIMPYEILRKSDFDIIVMGEGEHTMLDLAECLPDRDNLHDIPGICYKDGEGKIVVTKRRNFMEDIDRFSFPDNLFQLIFTGCRAAIPLFRIQT